MSLQLLFKVLLVLREVEWFKMIKFIGLWGQENSEHVKLLEKYKCINKIKVVFYAFMIIKFFSF